MITLTREEAQQVLDALEDITDFDRLAAVRSDLRARLAEPEKEATPTKMYFKEKTLFEKARAAGLAYEKGVWTGMHSHLERFVESLAQSEKEQEPAAWAHPDGRIWVYGRGYDKSTFTIPLYEAPPQREWQGLTDEEILKLFGVNGTADSDRNALAVLADAHKLINAMREKNK